MKDILDWIGRKAISTSPAGHLDLGQPRSDATQLVPRSVRSL